MDGLDNLRVELLESGDACLPKTGAQFAVNFQPIAAPSPRMQLGMKRVDRWQRIVPRQRRAFGRRRIDIDVKAFGRNV
jgi:hypothetical protein